MVPVHRLDPDDGSYDAFFDTSLPVVLAVARRLTGGGAGAEDIAVEALGRASAHWDRVSAMAEPRASVVPVAVNLVIGEARKRRPLRLPVAAEPDPADAVVVRGVLVAALRRLPRRQREAVALRYLADLPERDVAEAMGVTTGSVKKHLHRGLTALRDGLGGDLDRGGAYGLR